MESADMQLVMFALIATIPLVGAMMAITPLLQPNGQAFSVSVPEVAQSDPGIRVLKHRFVAIIAALTAILTLVAVVFCLMGSMKAVMALVVAGSLAPLVAGYGLIVRYRRRVQAIKRERGWQAEAQQRVAEIGEGAEDAPRAISLAWNWLYAPVILLTVGVAIAGYPVMPAQIPVHVDFSGAVTDVAAKSPAVAAFPIALELFLAGCFAFSHWTVLRSKKGTEPGNPASSAWAYGMFAHAQTAFLLVGGSGYHGGLRPSHRAFHDRRAADNGGGRRYRRRGDADSGGRRHPQCGVRPVRLAGVSHAAVRRAFSRR